MDAYKEAIRRFQCVYRYPMSCDVHGVDMPEQDIQQLAEYWAAENDPSKVPSFLKNCDTCGQSGDLPPICSDCICELVNFSKSLRRQVDCEWAQLVAPRLLPDLVETVYDYIFPEAYCPTC